MTIANLVETGHLQRSEKEDQQLEATIAGLLSLHAAFDRMRDSLHSLFQFARSPMTIKAHCMGMEFPKRDTDSPNVRWAFPLGQGYYRWACNCGNVSQMIEPPNWKRNYPFTDTCPKCADLDAVAEEQRVKEKTGG